MRQILRKLEYTYRVRQKSLPFPTLKMGQNFLNNEIRVQLILLVKIFEPRRPNQEEGDNCKISNGKEDLVTYHFNARIFIKIVFSSDISPRKLVPLSENTHLSRKCFGILENYETYVSSRIDLYSGNENIRLFDTEGTRRHQLTIGATT